MPTTSGGGLNHVSQAAPPTDAEPTPIGFTLVPDDPELVREYADDVMGAVSSGCGSVRLEDREIDVDQDGAVTVDAVNPTEWAASRVLHVVWGESESSWGTIPRQRGTGRLTWARGFVTESGFEWENED